MVTERWSTAALFVLISMSLSGMEAGDVVQTPTSIHVMEGESVILNCSFHLQGLGAYSWRRDDSPINFESPRYKQRIIKADHHAFKSGKDASIQITNTTECDSGTYYCEIEIMGKQKSTGNGTVVTVERHACDKAKYLKTMSFEWIWIAVAGGVTLLVTLSLLVVIIILARRNKAYALLVRECSSFDSTKELEYPRPFKNI
ncbi:natural cytotoxicity triggering receptor 3-like isoform X2 [Rhincodon typus]|uniref:natural cytotoxicity triggering receptor 3-like isoform X2 n=1 Tax=Rhincodon typus TaxID=259920 RepID=UPI00202FF82F|nr:natural cytotoxicity triggering receptor 3-like isoform X2 [Rhincodon typus]